LPKVRGTIRSIDSEIAPVQHLRPPLDWSMLFSNVFSLDFLQSKGGDISPEKSLSVQVCRLIVQRSQHQQKPASNLYFHVIIIPND
jgi:hypothetical protein